MNRPSLCWRCKKLIGLDPVCPYCGAKNTGAMQAIPKITNAFRSVSTPQALLYFCLGIFALSFIVGLVIPGGGGTLMRPSSGVLNVMGVNLFAKDPSRWWTMVTGVFLHIGVLHLAFNLYGLHVLGRYIEAPMGSAFLWVVFMLSALVGAFLTASFGNVSAGASGGLFGWMGAAIYLAFRTGGFGDPVFRSLLLWGGLSLFFGFSMAGRIDNFSHVGGLISGLFLTSVWSTFQRSRAFEKIVRVAAIILLALVIFSYFKQLRYILAAFGL